MNLKKSIHKMKQWKIKDLVIKNQIVIAPMAGVSNLSFRSILASYQPGLIYSEMISDKAIVYRNEKTIAMTQVNSDEHPIALQLFGEDIKTMVLAAQYLDTKTDCDIIDINMGCPVPKVIKGSGGASLLKRPAYAFELAKAVVDAVNKPVTVKLRVGWDNQTINVIEMALGLQASGISALSIHGRTRSAMYSGSVDYDLIRQVKELLSIPVMANGDITTLAEAKHVLVYTKADAIMIGRGILGKPWFIKELIDGLDGLAYNEPDSEQRFNIARKHALNLIESVGEKHAMQQMRSHFTWYLKGMPRSHQIKNAITQMTSYEQFDRIIKEYQAELDKMVTYE